MEHISAVNHNTDTTENTKNIKNGDFDSEVEVEDSLSGRCHNCHKIIEKTILDLHEAYCLKNMRRCEICREMFTKDDISSHVDAVHKKVACEHCEEEQEVSHLTQHQLDCEAKPKACYYCTGVFAVTDFTAHVYICGSRTEYCDLCRKYIILREFALHIEVCITKEQFPVLGENQPLAHKKQPKGKSAKVEKDRDEEEKLSWNLKKPAKKGSNVYRLTESTVVPEETNFNGVKHTNVEDNDENVHQMRRKAKKTEAKLQKFFESVIEESLENKMNKANKGKKGGSKKKTSKFDPSVTELQRAIEESLKIN